MEEIHYRDLLHSIAEQKAQGSEVVLSDEELKIIQRNALFKTKDPVTKAFKYVCGTEIEIVGNKVVEVRGYKPSPKIASGITTKMATKKDAEIGN